jgi:hypothetical protein
MWMAALRASAGGHRRSRGVHEAEAIEPRRGAPARRRSSRGRSRREEAFPMKRLWLAAILCASIASVCLSLTPREAAAWWTGDAYLERKVATEGDPEDPVSIQALTPNSVDDEDLSLSCQVVQTVLRIVVDALGL